MRQLAEANRKKTCGAAGSEPSDAAAMHEGPVAAFQLGPRKLCVVSLQRAQATHEHSQELARFTLHGQSYALVDVSHDEAQAPEPSVASLLTSRELQIASLVADGLLNKQIADRLRISEWTVCAHLRRIFSKLRVTTRAAMVYRCAGAVIGAPRLAGE